jgi:hypothetical protein
MIAIFEQLPARREDLATFPTWHFPLIDVFQLSTQVVLSVRGDLEHSPVLGVAGSSRRANVDSNACGASKKHI